MRKIQNYLADILVEIAAVEQFTRQGEEKFFSDITTQYAVMMAYIRIGEAGKQIPQSILDHHKSVDWKGLKGFRDVIIHRYHSTEIKLVWAAVTQLPALKATVEAMMAELEIDNSETDA